MDGIIEEVEVVNSIYENSAVYVESQSSVDLKVPDTNVEIRLWLPPKYPEESPRAVKASGVPPDSLDAIQRVIDTTFVPGEVYIFAFMDEVRAEAERLEAELEESERREKEVHQAAQQVPLNRGSQHIQEWSKSEEVKDRGSTFVGYAVKANSLEDVKALVADLALDRKISGASHIMSAWRIKLNPKDSSWTEDFDNDGESGAGATMLHILQMAKIENVLVVVVRYFHGTHIGPDRFRHIKNSAKAALLEGGFINK